MANFCTLHSYRIPELSYRFQANKTGESQMRIESNYEIAFPAEGRGENPVGVAMRAKIADGKDEIALDVFVTAYFTLTNPSLPEEDAIPLIKAEAFPMVAGLLEESVKSLAAISKIDTFNNLSSGLAKVIVESMG